MSMKPCNQVCGRCYRMKKQDMFRRYCPVTAKVAYPDSCADGCKFFLKRQERPRSDNVHRE